MMANAEIYRFTAIRKNKPSGYAISRSWGLPSNDQRNVEELEENFLHP